MIAAGSILIPFWFFNYKFNIHVNLLWVHIIQTNTSQSHTVMTTYDALILLNGTMAFAMSMQSSVPGPFFITANSVLPGSSWYAIDGALFMIAHKYTCMSFVTFYISVYM